MRNETIRRMVRDLFDYEPGSSTEETTSDIAIRLVRTEKSLSDGANAVGTPIDPSLHHALIECETVKPKVDDDLMIDAETFTLLQVVAADTGAGILYEVSYQ